jgi:hypothetical protein
MRFPRVKAEGHAFYHCVVPIFLISPPQGEQISNEDLQILQKMKTSFVSLELSAELTLEQWQK